MFLSVEIYEFINKFKNRYLDQNINSLNFINLYRDLALFKRYLYRFLLMKF